MLFPLASWPHQAMWVILTSPCRPVPHGWLTCKARAWHTIACSCMRGNGAHRAAWIMIAVHCREDASEAKETTREGSVKAVQHDRKSVGGMACPGNGNPQPCGPPQLASTYNGWPSPPKLCLFSPFLSSASPQSPNQSSFFRRFFLPPLFFLFSIIELCSIDLCSLITPIIPRKPPNQHKPCLHSQLPVN